ncbi:MAG: DUF1553 domain-containing protein [Verrucomicrobiaceae bacterium]|nr:DUF1553 domain-containing protein [Verrucomicrobiaceae bacterium]
MDVRVLTACSLLAAPVLGAAERPAHWAFQPLRKIQATGIDELLNQSLASNKLVPAAEADRRTLFRRASYDLTGLPPPEVDPGCSYEQFVDRLLASPHYGEQWARHWLDVARYSDTKGYVYGREEKRWVHAAAYRDWVVQALNSDMPYDRFLALQVAADQLVEAGSRDLAAMGLLTLGRRFLGVTHDIIDDRIDVVSRAALGLSVACARCHDHKFDPIPTSDYYSLYGVFQSSAEAVVVCDSRPASCALTDLKLKNAELMKLRREEQMKRTRSRVLDHLLAQFELDKYPEEVFGQLLDVDDLNPFIVRRWQAWLDRQKDPIFAIWHGWNSTSWENLVQLSDPRVTARFKVPPKDAREVAAVYAQVLTSAEFGGLLAGESSPCHVPDEHIANNEMYFPIGVTTELWKAQGEVDRHLLAHPEEPLHATVLVDRREPVTPRVFNRGNPLTKGQTVPRQFLSLFGEQKPFAKGSGRLELARQIASPQTPLTARVMVNRLWQHHFGRGIVATPSDFGVQGSAPSHPELLDWLARAFIDSGWSIKAMHRLIMTSAAYKRSAGCATSDPDNRWLSHFRPRRLSFEQLRDGWLMASGRLDLRVGGLGERLSNANHRRTLYSFIDREHLPGVLRTFDFANPDLTIAHRAETTVAQQALFGMNDPSVVRYAKLLSESLRGADKDKVETAYLRLFQRSPTVDELHSCLEFVSVAAARQAGGKIGPWEQMLQVLMLSNEFVFVD